jgi:hypothetical protein
VQRWPESRSFQRFQQGFGVKAGNVFIAQDGGPQAGDPSCFKGFACLTEQAGFDEDSVSAFGKIDEDGGHGRKHGTSATHVQFIYPVALCRVR